MGAVALPKYEDGVWRGVWTLERGCPISLTIQFWISSVRMSVFRGIPVNCFNFMGCIRFRICGELQNELGRVSQPAQGPCPLPPPHRGAGFERHWITQQRNSCLVVWCILFVRLRRRQERNIPRLNLTMVSGLRLRQTYDQARAVNTHSDTHILTSGEHYFTDNRITWAAPFAATWFVPAPLDGVMYFYWATATIVRHPFKRFLRNALKTSSPAYY